MSDDSDVKLDMRNLQKLLRSFNQNNPPIARVGILGSSNARESKDGGATSNATVGAAHEFGTSRLPQRSFLRIPITENMQKYLAKSGAFTKEAAQKVLNERSLLPWLEKVAVTGEAIVLDAFETGGFGKWKPSQGVLVHFKKINPKWRGMQRGRAKYLRELKKNNKQTLVDTQQLRNSITSEVK